jgi:BolA protein
MSVQTTIESRLAEKFSPEFLLVENESHMHNVPAGSESHFKVQIVSQQFENQMLIHRHRAVNKALSDELANQIHALSIHAFSPDEWKVRGGKVSDSPPCHGGGK